MEGQGDVLQSGDYNPSCLINRLTRHRHDRDAFLGGSRKIRDEKAAAERGDRRQFPETSRRSLFVLRH